MIVDVRSDAVREWVGFVPNAAPLALNPDFDRGPRALPADKRLLMLCRSGVRSIVAARRATELGFEAYDILEGFEGNPDQEGRRGRTGGWRFHAPAMAAELSRRRG